MKLLTYAAGFIIFASPAVHGESATAVRTDELCQERPDMCGGSAVKKKKKKKSKKKKVARNSENDFDGLLDELSAEEAGDLPRREPASGRPRRISFTSYLNANANHPSIAGGSGGRQEAFVVPIRPSSITGPSSVNVPVGDAGADGLSMKDNPPAASSSSTSGSYPNN